MNGVGAVNRVAYIPKQQGWRPETNPMRAALGGDISFFRAVDAEQSISPPWWSYLFPGGTGAYVAYKTGGLIFGSTPGDVTLNPANAVTGELTPQQVNEIKEQAASAIVNAAGGDVERAQADIAQTNSDIDATLGSSFSFSSLPWWLWVGVGVGALALVKRL